MKKFLLLVLSLSVLAVLSACSDSGSNSNNGGGAQTPTVTQPTLTDIKTLNGTYNIEFFYTNAAIAAITTDCSKISTYVPAATVKCGTPNDESVTHYGQGTIQVLDNGSVKIQTKLQMNGGIFNNPNNNGALEILMGQFTPNKYTFTDFNYIPKEAISTTKINDPATAKNVKGTSGRSATALASNGAENTYEFTVLSDGTVINNMVDNSITSAAVVVRMKKVSDTVTPLEPNTQYPTPVIDNFSNEITYTPAN